MNVKVYSTPTCPWCMRLKQFLKENKVEFEDIDVSKDKDAAKKLVQKTGQAGVPVTEINGEMIVGFDESKLKQNLKI